MTPLELVFCGVRDEQVEEQVAIRNMGSEPVQVVAVEIGGDEKRVFKISTLPLLPLTLPPGKQASVGVTFAPTSSTAPGVSRALLHVLTGLQREEGPPVDLAGLTLLGKRGDKEPPLQQVVEALGFALNVGRPDLQLGTGADSIGDEVKAQRFRRANKSQVSFYSVARFAPDQRIPYGYYTGDSKPQLQTLGVIAGTQAPTLNPDMEPDGRTTFDPGPGSFGIFAKSAKAVSYTEDRLNDGRHAVRVYPLKSRAGGRVPDAYVLAFEQTGDADYQDAVFVIWNVQAEP